MGTFKCLILTHKSLNNFFFKSMRHAKTHENNTHDMSRIIDYSKWDQLKYSSSEEEDDDEGEKEAEITRSSAVLEKLSLCSSSSSPLWNGLVLHHKDVFVSHVIPKLNETDRCFFSMVGRESRGVLAYAEVKVSELCVSVWECASISTLELLWNDMAWGEKFEDGTVRDQALFCAKVALTNKLEFLKWAREVKHCEWDELTITTAGDIGNLEMLKYCISNECPCDEEASCKQAALGGPLNCLRFLVDKVKPSRETEKYAARQAACGSHMDIVKYFVEERKISDDLKLDCVGNAVMHGRLDCLKYLVEEAKVPLNDWQDIACARVKEHHDCVNYLLEKGSPEPTDEQYAAFAEHVRALESQQGNNFH